MYTVQTVFLLIEQRQGKIHEQIVKTRISLCSPLEVFAIRCRLSLLIENEKILDLALNYVDKLLVFLWVLTVPLL